MYTNTTSCSEIAEILSTKESHEVTYNYFDKLKDKNHTKVPQNISFEYHMKHTIVSILNNNKLWPSGKTKV